MQNAIDKINALQRRILAGEDPSADEMNEAIQQLRSERGDSVTIAEGKAKKAKAKSASVDIAALFGAKKAEEKSE